MSRLLNGLIAFLLPAMVGCGTANKVQDVPEEIYACPMPSDDIQDEPVEEPDTTTINNNK